MFLEITAGALALCYVALSYCAIKFFKNRRDSLEQLNQKLLQRINDLHKDMSSLRVKHGFTFERFVPLMPRLEAEIGPKEHFAHIGMPIDYVHFGDNVITFVEVKTGNGSLSHKQKRIRELVQNKHVRWLEIYDEKDRNDWSVLKDLPPTGLPVNSPPTGLNDYDIESKIKIEPPPTYEEIGTGIHPAYLKTEIPKPPTPPSTRLYDEADKPVK